MPHAARSVSATSLDVEYASLFDPLETERVVNLILGNVNGLTTTDLKFKPLKQVLAGLVKRFFWKRFHGVATRKLYLTSISFDLICDNH
jgi:hypothetical protein